MKVGGLFESISCSYGSIIAVSEDDQPFNEEEDDGSFVLPTPSSSSSSSYVSEDDEEEFAVSSDEADEMESEVSHGSIDPSTVIGELFFYGVPMQRVNPLQTHLRRPTLLRSSRRVCPKSCKCSC